jgi:hypothetical protein
MAYEVEVTDQFVTWWETLSENEQEELSARVTLLERLGPTMRRPYSGEIEGSEFDPKMKALRCNVGRAYLRVLYIFDPRQTAILLLGGDKTGLWSKWYDQNIPIADELYKEHLTELSNEGLI